MPLLTILVPAFNEEKSLPLLRQRLDSVLEKIRMIGIEAEIILLDNRSNDGTGDFGRSVCQEDNRWRYVRYSRNFGYHNSLAAGFDLAKGDALIVLAADLQEPPELIPQMVELWRQGHDVAYGVLRTRSDSSWIKTLGARIFYPLFSYLSDCDIPLYATDFRIISRRVIDAVKEMREADRYLRGLVHWTGFRQTAFVYDRDKRQHGESKVGIWPSVKWGLNAIFCFSHTLLRAMAIFGIVVMLASILLSVYFVIHYFFPFSSSQVPMGTTAIIMLALFGIGLNAFFLGIIGEYIGRIYRQSKRRPLYIIDEAVNIVPHHMIG